MNRPDWTLERVAHRVLHLLVLAGLLLMVAVVIVPLTRSERPGYEGSLLTAVPLVVVAQLMSHRVGRFVDWLLYGLRDDPSAAAWQVAKQLESAPDEDSLPALVTAVAAALRLSYVQVCIGSSGQEQVAAVHGSGGGAVSSFELRHAGERLGVLSASRRGQPLTPADDRVLRVLAAQLAGVVHAGHLNAALRQAREGLVLSREDERRRLRRDLHDGVGPALAGIALGLETAGSTMSRDPDRAQILLDDLRREISGVIADVRRAVDGLRPPLLDEIGLGSAVAQSARSFAERTGVLLDLHIDPLPRLPAAVEVGAYRIAVEALTNAARHAGAQSWTVDMHMKGPELVVAVADDGKGLGTGVPGNGLASLRERAEELGGHLEITSGPAGTSLLARLPCPGGAA